MNNTYSMQGRVPPHRRFPIALRVLICLLRRGHHYRVWLSPYQFTEGALRRMCRCTVCGHEKEEAVPE